MNDDSARRVSDEWVMLRNCGTIHEAYFFRSVLEGSGIESFLPDEHMSAIRPELVWLLGGVRLMVPKSQAPYAAEVLAQVETGPDAGALPDD